MNDKLTTKAFGRTFLTFDEIDSTNNYLRDNREALPHGACAAARFQTAGKGRAGRRWMAPPDSGMILSILLRPGKEAPFAAALPLAAGVACVQALASFGVPAKLKWPNDVLVGDKKAGGILCESVGGDFVCGIGVNLMQPAGYFHEAGLPHGTSVLAAAGKTVAWPDLAAEVLNRFEPLWERMAEGQSILDVYAPLCATVGRMVRVLSGDGTTIFGAAVRVAASGGLLVKTENGETITVTAGDVSVRGETGYF